MLEASSASRLENRALLVSAIHLAASGDAAGLRNVYDLTSAKLFGICLRICADREAAEDVLQDVYVKVWRRAASFDASRASPVSWLATIARNAAVDWRRAEHRHDAMPYKAMAAIADDAPLADALMEGDEERRRLLVCIEGLPSEQSSAIRSAFLQGFTYQQLAERSDTPLGTVKSWIRRGMLRLKDCLGHG
ncbi:sigma-70 family RNA polymerase sigma factor [Novosphingobium sp. fls2-241-R2A-195]|jgi:RNA polymerase sigma-70 factor (ECF subfamily)|uniref:sigma-70 family RNA polymerase sigma factor n=1 Tax=Novosphingobium sp. fls2-241-R2A-195 TaxID=3040296 RepID=UPI00254EAE02|nr:sigma-70 family RNA polymerase sigma factor [Novosphingobium sp. fls2-241-R2A-195]